MKPEKLYLPDTGIQVGNVAVLRCLNKTGSCIAKITLTLLRRHGYWKNTRGLNMKSRKQLEQQIEALQARVSQLESEKSGMRMMYELAHKMLEDERKRNPVPQPYPIFPQPVAPAYPWQPSPYPPHITWCDHSSAPIVS